MSPPVERVAHFDKDKDGESHGHRLGTEEDAAVDSGERTPHALCVRCRTLEVVRLETHNSAADVRLETHNSAAVVRLETLHRNIT